MVSKAGFIWKKSWKPFITLIVPILLSVIFIWGGTELGTAKKASPATTTPAVPATTAKINDKYKDLKPCKKPTPSPPPPKWKQPRAAFVILLMAIYWISECLPLSVTALCPVFLFPLLQISDTESVTSSYLNSSVLLLLSGCIIALAFEYSNLHNRIALGVIRLVGAKIPRLLFGIMATAMFLSMWMNNTSTTAMMVPIVDVIMKEFENLDEEEEAEEEVRVITAEPEMPVEKPVTDGKEDVNEVAPRRSRFGMDSNIQIAVKEENTVPTTNVVKPVESKTPSVKTISKSKKDSREIKIMFLLAVAWAANLGGTGVLTGTATNIIAQEEIAKTITRIIAEGKVKDKELEKCKDVMDINFLEWIKFNVFPMLVNTIVCWFILLIYFRGLPRWMRFWKKKTAEEMKAVQARELVTKNIEAAIRAKYVQLGPVSLHEIFVLIIFSLLVILWIGGGKIGWFQWFTDECMSDGSDKPTKIWYLHDAVPAIFLCLFLFILPKEKKYYKNFMSGGLQAGMRDPVLMWKFVETKVPWGPLVLIGGGSAISGGISKSGLGLVIGRFLSENKALSSLYPSVFLIIILIIVALLTTIASNTATAAILSPVLINLSITKGIHPLYMLIVPTVAASYSFILPISTPPNAIVFDKSDMKQKEMALPGIIVTIVTNIVLFILVHTYNNLIYKFSDYKNPCKPL